MKKILAVDDEENNLLLLKEHFEDYKGFELTTYSDSIKGLNALINSNGEFDLLLLDRMMPNMNGIEFIEKLNTHTEVRKIPIIMQTAAAEKKQIQEGIEAGIYYYLTKPFSEELLFSIVNAALRDAGEIDDIKKKVADISKCQNNITECEWQFSTLEEVHNMAAYISTLFPEPERSLVGILELIINAVEHGNLNITFSEKTELMRSGKWEEEIKNRLLLNSNKDKKVTVKFIRYSDSIELTIRDLGDGFDWQDFLEISSERAALPHGRGIALSKLNSFDSLEYQAPGNIVICKVNLT